MINKIVPSLQDAVAGIQDGSTVLVSGFGGAGQPHELIDALIDQGAKDLVLVNNNAGNGETGIAKLMKLGRVRKIICSFPRQVDSHVFDGLFRAGKIELELVPQGTLAERIRAGGAGIGGFYTRTAVGTVLAEGKEIRKIDGEDYIYEPPIKADVALVKALRGDRWGNLVYRKTARNFGPVMATAAKLTIVSSLRNRRVGRDGSRGDRDARHLCQPYRPCRAKGETMKRMSRDEIAARVAKDIPEGSYVNLGIGLPTRVGNYLPADKEIFLHSENGVLGMGPAPAPGQEDYDLINAGKQPVTLLKGGSYFHHADSFAMMRGGHLDICVLGAFQVSRHGDLANWHTGEPDAIPAVGGAMDLAAGARSVFVMMDIQTKDGQSKLVERCTYPLTGVGCVSRVYTDVGVFQIEPGGVVRVVDDMSGAGIEALRQITGLDLQS